MIKKHPLEKLYEAVSMWPFELPKPYRRAFIILFPVTFPPWLGGAVLVGIPAMLALMVIESIGELWR